MVVEVEMLKAIFGSERKGKILLYIYTHREAYPTEMAKAFKFYLNTVQNQLLAMERDGILYSRLRGKVRLFGLNPRYPFKEELEMLLEKILDFIPQRERETYYMPRLRPRRTGKPL